jgi:hypothetical protein
VLELAVHGGMCIDIDIRVMMYNDVSANESTPYYCLIRCEIRRGQRYV